VRVRLKVLLLVLRLLYNISLILACVEDVCISRVDPEAVDDVQ